MWFISTYGKEIIALLVPFITWVLNVGLKAKAKLIWTSPHSFSFLVQEPIRDEAGNIIKPNQLVNTASIRVINVGRETATKVELVFNWTPQYINLWPVRYYERKIDDDNRHIMIFDNLSPKEEIGIEVMSINQDLPSIIVVRSAQCQAAKVPLMWVRYSAPWKVKLAAFLILLGLGALVYLVILLIQFLVLKTP